MEGKIEIIFEDGAGVRCKKADQPKMTENCGRKWKNTEAFLNGRLVKFHFETTRGTSYYFMHDESWYKLPFIMKNGSKQIMLKNEKLLLKEEI